MPTPNETPSDETYQRRGVVNPRIVDLITRDPDTDTVLLKIFEPRPWGAVDRQLFQLEDKLNAYFGYVLDGHLAQQYPQYEGKRVRIQLECVEGPGELEEEFMDAVETFCESQGLGFSLRVVEDPAQWRAPWEG